MEISVHTISETYRDRSSCNKYAVPSASSGSSLENGSGRIPYLNDKL
jgi:hypothetical protein